MKTAAFSGAGTGLICLFASPPAAAHGFGQRFDLPLPLWLWVTGAGATVVLSFVVAALFLRETPRATDYPRLDLLQFGLGRAIARPSVIESIRTLVAAVFVITHLAGWFGTPDPFRNLVPTAVWVLWWVGFAFVCALVGDVWALVNPLRTVFTWAEALHARVTGGRPLSRSIPYPSRLGVWPSVLLFLAFAWSELVWAGNDVPSHLATAISFYAALTWIGMFVYGRDVWLQNAEAFSMAFGVLARFAPLEVRVKSKAAIAGCANPGCRRDKPDCVNGRACLASAPGALREWNLRPPAVGLLNDNPVSWPLLVFVLLMLATITFDGFLETPVYQGALKTIYSTPALSRPVFTLSELGVNAAQLFMSATLVAFPLAFVAIFVACAWLMARVAKPKRGDSRTRGRYGAGEIARSFVLTLVPIAIAYHLGHYLSLLLTAGQFIVPLISDPFGFGWDLFGSADYKVDIGVVGARFVWYTAVIAIVIGHVLSVYLAHVVAMRLFGDRSAALLSQLPMIALMIGYTMLSLWIFAQPIVG